MVNYSLILCRIRGYIIHVSSMSFRYTLILMCADRYASCNSRASIRALCRPQTAYRSIGILTLFWMIASIHLLTWESIANNRCFVYGIYGQIFGFYILIFTGTIPVLCIIFIRILLMKNLRQMRSRVRPLDNTRQINQRGIKLMKIVLAETIVYVLCTFTYSLMMIYTSITNNMWLQKSAERKQIESFINFLTMSVLFYTNYNITFYVHILTSKTYRVEIKQLILKLIGRRRDMEPNQGTIGQTANQMESRQ